MKKVLKDYCVLIVSLVIAIAIVVYDMNFYWPAFLDWIEGHRWYAIIPFISLALLNLYFPLIDKKKRSIKTFFKEITNTPEKKKKLAFGSTASVLVAAIGIYFSVFYEKPMTTKTASNTQSSSSSNQGSSETTQEAQAPEVIEAAEFSEKEKSPFEPDIVILTKKVADLPKELIQNSFLSKIITKETMFYYEDDPQYLGVLGTIRRLAYEHKVELKDSVVKYILSMPAEIALWKSTDGKVRDFLFISTERSLNKNILDFYLQFKQVTTDQKVETFSYNGVDGYYLEVRGKKLAVWSHKNKLYVSNMHPKYFPDKNEKKLNELLANKYSKKIEGGFFSKLLGANLGSNKHSIVLSSDYISFGYNYFFPEISAIKLDFKSKSWNLSSLTNAGGLKGDSNTSALWMAFPKSAAMCIGIPINPKRIAGIISKYKSLTKTRFEEAKNKSQPDSKETTTDKPEGASVEEKVEEKVVFADFEKSLFTDEEIAELIKHPIGVCWYERSTIYTPLFIAKMSGGLAKKEKLKFLFEKFIGGLEKDYEYQKLEENSVGKFQSYSRLVSSKYGLHSNDGEKAVENLKFKKYFKTKLSFNDEYTVFSPDSSLTDLAVSTLSKKSPSISDQLKVKNKNLSYLLSPFGLSQLLNKYMKEALPSSQESVFRTSVEKHLSKTFKNLSSLGSFGIEMPKANNEKHAKWEKLKIHNL
jgi:uncharacterized protein YfaA (DUF2138 family)